jgi:hypothetical protein
VACRANRHTHREWSIKLLLLLLLLLLLAAALQSRKGR